MSIDIAAEIKFVFVSKGEYLVRLQDTEQTCIGKVLQADDGWKSYTIQPDQSWKGSFSSFGNTRYLASRSLLEAYELANGLRDSEGLRVTKDPETGLWFVANHYGGRESSRWTDKADAIAKLASLQVPAPIPMPSDAPANGSYRKAGCEYCERYGRACGRHNIAELATGPREAQQLAADQVEETILVAHRASRSAAERYIAAFANELGDTTRWDGKRSIPIHVEWTVVPAAKGFDIVSTVTPR